MSKKKKNDTRKVHTNKYQSQSDAAQAATANTLAKIDRQGDATPNQHTYTHGGHPGFGVSGGSFRTGFGSSHTDNGKGYCVARNQYKTPTEARECPDYSPASGNCLTRALSRPCSVLE